MVYVITLMFTSSMSRGTCVHCLHCGAVLTFSKPPLLPLVQECQVLPDVKCTTLP